MKVLLSFRAGNAGLGNRDAYRAADSVTDDGGRVTLCPLCLGGPYVESHLLLHCPELRTLRTRTKVSGGLSLEESLEVLRVTQGPSGDDETIRCYLGQTGHPLSVMVERGLALDILLDEFFRVWTVKCGRTQSRKPFFNYI